MAAAELLLARRGRYNDLYGLHCRLVAVGGSRAEAYDDAGLELDQLAALAPGLSGPELIKPCGVGVLIEAGAVISGRPSLAEWTYAEDLTCRGAVIRLTVGAVLMTAVPDGIRWSGFFRSIKLKARIAPRVVLASQPRSDRLHQPSCIPTD